jgi:hypothetical protein
LYSLHSVGEIDILGNDSLTSLNGLQGLENVTNSVSVQYNLILSSLDGIDNIKADSMLFLRIQNNDTLSECSIKSVCDFLGIPESHYYIENNAPGCNSPEEVEAACGVGVEESAVGGQRSAVRPEGEARRICIYPNPASNQVTFDIHLQSSAEVKLMVFNSLGQQVATLSDVSEDKGDHQILWNTSEFPSGIYFYLVSEGNELFSGKIFIAN